MKQTEIIKRIFVILMIMSVLLMTGCKTDISRDYTNESPEDFDKRMEWWRDAGFGMFIHWGAYAVPAGIYQGEEIPGIGEWIMNNAED